MIPSAFEYHAPTSIEQAAQWMDGERYVVDEVLVPRLDLYLVLVGDGPRRRRLARGPRGRSARTCAA